MVHRSRMHRCPIMPSRQASSNIGRQDAVHRGVVHALVKHEGFRIRWRRLTEPRYPFDGDMRMPNNIPVVVEHLRCSQVSRIRVREVTGGEISDRDLNGEGFVLCEILEVRGEYELGRGLVVHARNHTYRSGVA